MENLTEIKNYDGYFLSKEGEVYSHKLSKPRKLKQQKATQSVKGYYQVRLYKKVDGSSVGTLYYVHRLMYETFVGEIPIDKQIDHIDGDTANNVVENLQLLTKRQNLKKYHKKKNFKFRQDRDIMIKDYAELKTFAKVAEKHGCSPSTVWYVINDVVLVHLKGGGFKRVPYTID